MFAEMAVSLVVQKDAVAEFVNDIQIGPTVVVGIEPDGAEGGGAVAAGAALGCHILESPAPHVAPQTVALRAFDAGFDPRVSLGHAVRGHVQINTAIPIKIDHGEA